MLVSELSELAVASISNFIHWAGIPQGKQEHTKIQTCSNGIDCVSCSNQLNSWYFQGGDTGTIQ